MTATAAACVLACATAAVTVEAAAAETAAADTGGPPATAHTVRVDRDEDARLDGLAAAVRAEMVAGGFRVLAGGGRSGDLASPAAAVITLRVAGDRVRVEATAAGVATPFAAEVALGTAGGGQKRVVDRVALQAAEWLAAIWLPPPAAAAAAPSPATPPLVAFAVVESEPVEEALLAPPPAAPPEAAARPTARATATPVAAPRRWATAFDAGAAVLRTPNFTRRFGPELGAALHGTRRLAFGPTPFVRLSLALLDGGAGLTTDTAGDTFDINYASASLATGLDLRLGDRWSVEANAGMGLTLLRYTVHAATIDPPGLGASGHTWIATPGGAAGLVLHLSEHGALVLEGRGVWLLPPPVFVAFYGQAGGSPWPALAAALALRITL